MIITTIKYHHNMLVMNENGSALKGDQGLCLLYTWDTGRKHRHTLL